MRLLLLICELLLLEERRRVTRKERDELTFRFLLFLSSSSFFPLDHPKIYFVNGTSSSYAAKGKLHLSVPSHSFKCRPLIAFFYQASLALLHLPPASSSRTHLRSSRPFDGYVMEGRRSTLLPSHGRRTSWRSDHWKSSLVGDCSVVEVGFGGSGRSSEDLR